MRLDYFAAKKYVRMEVEGTGKNIVFHPKGEIQGPYTDGTTLHVFEPDSGWTDNQWTVWEYEIYHEIGHEAPENCNPHWKDVVEEKKYSTQSFFGHVVNAVSDHIQEHNRVGVYRGRDDTIMRGRYLWYSDSIDKPSWNKPCKEDKASAFKALMLWDAIQRSTWNEHMSGVGEGAMDRLHKKEREYFDRLYNSDIKLYEGTSEYDSYELAGRIIDVLGFDAEAERKSAEDQYASEQKQREGKEGKVGKDGEGNGKSGRSKGKGNGASSGDGEENGEAWQEEVEGMVFHSHWKEYNGEETAFNTSGMGQHIDYSTYNPTGNSYVPREFTEIDLSKGTTRYVDKNYTNSVKADIEAVVGGKMLASQVKKLLVSMKQLRWDHSKRRGHISSKNLWKSRGPIYSQDVFKQRASQIELDTAVCVLTDNSGSMCGTKFCHAARAGLMLNEAFGKIGVPTELLSFSDEYDMPIHAVVKAFSESSVTEDALTERYAMVANWMGGNADGESIMWAAQRLAKRKESRRVLIVLSDGSPAAYNEGDVVRYTKDVVEKIEDSSIEIYGIGIMDRNVERIYKNTKVLGNASELENMLIGLVKNQVLGIK